MTDYSNSRLDTRNYPTNDCGHPLQAFDQWRGRDGRLYCTPECAAYNGQPVPGTLAVECCSKCRTTVSTGCRCVLAWRLTFAACILVGLPIPFYTIGWVLTHVS